MTEALLGMGGNVGDTRATLARAVPAFCQRPDIRLLARSSDYRTPPWGLVQQPPFVNICIAVETSLSPRALLEHALAVEDLFGRDRSTEPVWGPRPLDIDLLLYGDLAIDEPWLKVPHPRMLDRPFVLVPLIEIRPALVVSCIAIADALAKLDVSGIEKLAPAPAEQRAG